jgi:hypothetical protein
MDVRMPDGTIITNVPEGTTKEQLLAKLGKPQQETYDPTEGMSTTDKVLAGAGKAIYDIGRGAGQLVGLVDRADIEESRRLDAPLMNTGAGKVGNFVGNVAAFAPTAFIPGANTYTGAGVIGAGIGLLQPSTSTAETVTNVGAGAAGGVVGKRLGDAINGFLTRRATERAAQAPMNEARTAIVREAQDRGYVIPPADADAGLGSKVLNALSGKIKTEQKASTLNQPITNRLVARDLGLPEDEPITREAINAVRKQAGEAYETIRGAGLVKPDTQFRLKLEEIGKANANAAKDFPELANTELQTLIDGVKKDQFDAGSAVDVIRILRDKSDSFYTKGDKGLGKAAKQIADEMESLLGRHLERAGAAPEVLSNFQNARKLIAKTYTAEKALNPTTGNVAGQKLARDLAKGKPLEGGMRSAAEFAQAFPKSAQDISSVNPYSILDAFVGAGGLVSNPAITGGVVARPVARSVILNPAYQRTFVAPQEPGNSLRNLLIATEAEAVPLGAVSGLSLASQVNQ